jgi:hypothetical protein
MKHRIALALAIAAAVPVLPAKAAPVMRELRCEGRVRFVHIDEATRGKSRSQFSIFRGPHAIFATISNDTDKPIHWTMRASQSPDASTVYDFKQGIVGPKAKVDVDFAMASLPGYSKKVRTLYDKTPAGPAMVSLLDCKTPL